MAVEQLPETPSLRPIYAKAALGALPVVGGGGGDELPDRALEVPEVEIEREHLTEYDRVCGFRLGDELPPTYLHVHAFPLAMKLMTDRSFPFSVMGLVHIGNRIEHARPVQMSEAPSLRVHAEDLRDHDKGRQFDVVAEASIDGERVWHSTSTYLKRGAGGSDRGSSDGGSSDEGSSPGEGAPLYGGPAAVWPIPDDIGRRYAAVSGDVNPIHMRSATARLFGFPRAIAHGMWMKARCLAAFEGSLPERYTVEVEFGKPVLLPSKVAFRDARRGSGWAFDLRDPKSGKPHLTGSIRA
jgi:MaoC like domain